MRGLKMHVNVDDEAEAEEALKSPMSRVYLCPKTDQIINCAMGLRYPIDVNALKTAFSNSLMIKHPRFCSLMVRNHAGEHWRKTQVNIDDHVIIHSNINTEDFHVEDDVEEALNAYLADVAVSTPLSMKKPLWEVHVLLGLNCVVLRVHHAVCDGASLMSMLSACFEKRENGGVEVLMRKSEQVKKWKERGVWGWVKTAWLTVVYGVKYLGRLLWVKDEKSVIYGGDGVELWPRKLETVKFELQDFKFIKQALPNATINDVLLGVISSGLSKYLHLKSPKALMHGVEVTALMPVNLRSNSGLQESTDIVRGNKTWYGSSSFGNKTGTLLQPLLCCQGLHPFDHVKRMKAIIDRKKLSYEAHIPYISLKLLASSFGSKVASWCSHRIQCNTTLLISNIMGPSKQIAIAGNPVTYMRVNISSMPQALTIHMVSYAGKADLQVMIAKDIITDPQLLPKCFKDSLFEMKTYVTECNNISQVFK